jgi:SAM-dependent methyltransferase
MPTAVANETVQRLVRRDATRTEADLQADVYVLLTSGGLALDPGNVARLEVQLGDGTRRRLDVEIGHCVIEVKKDLRPTGIRREAEGQLAGYVATQHSRLGTRYAGILTDGTDWYLYQLEDGSLAEVAHLSLNPSAPDTERLLTWLEAILSTQTAITPVPEEIRRRLGAESPAHLLDHATLKVLYKNARNLPEVELKRDLWAKLLRTAFGKAFSDDEDLFIDHTLLVLTAEIIAHAVVGFDVSPTGSMSPPALVRGTAFASAQIYGVVEADFFDWVLHAPGGSEFISALAHRIARFNWSHVEHDVLKVLYESVISQEARASLGEYYTPDWLAERVVDAAVAQPLDQRVLDPACGSGTFLFHAVRRYLDAAESAGIANGRAVADVTAKVFGMDIHPVAVTLARVTYLLAIGRSRLARDDRGPISIPVYLGDSLQWEQHRDLLGGNDDVTISTAGDDLVDGGSGVLFGDDLVFPRRVLHDAGDFDRLVSVMANKALDTSSTPSSTLIEPTLRQFGIHEDDIAKLTATFDTMRRLHGRGQNHIWGYYVRNLIRPLWLSELNQQVDVLVGNPPWLRYNKMTGPMQKRYKQLSKERGLLTGGLGASGRDLSTLFVVRAVELYLKPAGRFSFVMPHGTLTRKPHTGFRSGSWSSRGSQHLTAGFSEAWDLRNAPTGFPMVSCVIHGASTGNQAQSMPVQVQVWTAKLPSPNVTWAVASSRFTITRSTLSVLNSDDIVVTSPYKKRFRQGAIFVPRALIFAMEGPVSPIGPGAGRIAVTSRRTTSEKMPWKAVESIPAIPVERAFVRGIHLGETLLPYRMTAPLRAVLPVSSSEILSESAIQENDGLAEWWDQAEKIWKEHKAASDASTLRERINYHGQLAAQIPTARHRVVYSKAGNMLAAGRVEDPSVLIDHKLYWAAVSSLAEAQYLTAILNSETLLERVKPLQALGLFGGRDFDKNVFNVPIPVYDSANASHVDLVQLAARAEEIALAANVEGVDFKRARGVIRRQLVSEGIAADIEAVVARVVPIPETPDGGTMTVGS